MTTDPYRGMTPEDAARARQHYQDALKVQKAREAAARALLAPPGPAQAVRDAWQPIRDAQTAAKTPVRPDLKE